MELRYKKILYKGSLNSAPGRGRLRDVAFLLLSAFRPVGETETRQGIYSQMEKIHKFQSWIRSAGAGVVEEERKVWEGHPGAVEALEAQQRLP